MADPRGDILIKWLEDAGHDARVLGLSVAAIYDAMNRGIDAADAEEDA